MLCLPRLWQAVIASLAFSASFCIMGFVSSALAESASEKAEIRGMDMSGYGRIILNFRQLPKAEVTINNSILVWKFERPIVMRVDKLPNELSQYVAGARLDPDGKTLRLALAQTLRFNLQDAGNVYYLDLLPKSWTAANPSIPADIVSDLSRRVREAEADLRSRQAALEREINFEGGEGDAVSVLRVIAPDPDAIKFVVNKEIAELHFTGRYRIETKNLSSALPKSVRFIRAVQEENEFKIILDIGSKNDVRSHFDGDVFVLEFHSRNAGTLDIDGITNMRKGEWTGSASEPEMQNQNSSQNRIYLLKENNSDVIEIVSEKDIPIASFSADGKLFFLFPTDQKFELSEFSSQETLAIKNLEAIGSADMQGVAVSLREQRYPHIEKHKTGYRIKLENAPQSALQDIEFVALPGSRDETRLVMALSDASDVLNFQDLETGASYFAVPSHVLGLGIASGYRFQEFAIEASTQGLAIRKFADDVAVSMDAGAVVVSRPRGLNSLTLSDHERRNGNPGFRSVIKAQNYNIDRNVDALQLIRVQSERVINSEPKDLFSARLRLARLYASLELYPEAAGMYERAISERVSSRIEPPEEIELLLYRTLAGEASQSFARLTEQDMNVYPDAALLSAYHLARQGRMSEAIAAYRASGSILASYPSVFVRRILPALAEAAIEAQDANFSSNLVAALAPYVDDPLRDFYRYLSARYLDLSGQKDDAAAILNDLVNSPDRGVSVRARLANLMRDQTDTQEAVAGRLAILEGLQTIWRGDWIEARIVMELVKLAFKSGDWRRGFLAMQTINRYYAESPGARTLLDTATSQLELLFDEHTEKKLGAVEAVSLFMDFREFMPVGRRGDEVIRKLTDKLVDLDLLSQAAELMRYQIDNRLEGQARALAVPRLAYVYLLDKRPKDALAFLNETRMNGLSDDLQRSRLLLEARARADLGDAAGAYELVEALSGDDVDRLRAEIAWRAKDWKRAAELSELAIGEEWKAPEKFQNDSALYAVRAAIGYTLIADRLSLDRIRGRYVNKFGDRPDAAAFRFLTAPTAKRSPFESEYAASYKGGSTIDGFMNFYRENYLDKPIAQKQASALPG